MKKIRFQTRINIAFVLLLFTWLIGVFTFYRMYDFNLQMDTFYKHPFVVLNAAGTLRERASRMNHWGHHYAYSNTQERITFNNEIVYNDSLTLQAIQTIKSTYLGPQKDLDSLQASYDAYRTFIQRVLNLKNNEDTLAAIQLLEQNEIKKMNHLLAQIETISNFSQKNADTLYLNTVKSGKERFNFFWMVIVFLIGLSLFLAYALSRSITTPINRFIKDIKAIYGGETSTGQHDLLKASEEKILSLTANELKDNYQKLNSFKDMLEAKVKARTQELKESEGKFKLLFEKSKDALLIIKNEMFVNCNEAAVAMFGYASKDILLNKHPSEISPKTQPNGRDSYDLAHEKILESLKQGSQRFEWIHKKSNGQEFPVEVLLTNIVNEPNNQVVYCVLRDITVRKEIDLKLKEAKFNAEQSWQYLENIVNNIGDPVFVKDQESKYVMVNDAFCSMFKLSREQLIATSEIENIQKDENETYWSIDKQVLETGEENINEETMTLKGEETKTIITRKTRYIDHNGKKFIIGIIKDFSDRKKIEQELIKSKETAEHSEEFLNNIINKIIDPVFVKDDKSRLLVVNDAFCRMFETTAEDVLGQTMADAVSEKERELFLKIDQHVIETGEDSITEETLTIRNKQTFTILTRKSRFVDEQGKKFIIGIITDISLLKKNEIELLKAKEKAEESERLKSAFLANMSHEIRTPMNAILGFSNLLEDKKLDAAKRSKFIKLISDSGNRLLHIISDIIDVSKINANQLAVHLKPCNLNEIINNLYYQFSIQIKNKEIKLETFKALEDDDCHINTDSLRLFQVLSNLIENALKFTQKGLVRFGYTIESDMLYFFVEDSGMGIEEQSIDIIFERFHQGNNQSLKTGKGNGLGLAISKGIVELLGGTIWLENTSIMGSTFMFTIPFKPVYEADFKIVQPHQPLKIREKNLKTILIVEDEVTNFIYLREVLKVFNFKIIHVPNGLEAVEQFTKHKQDIDLVFMDIKMPIMDGYEATINIRKLNSTIPIIAITAYAMEEDEIKAMKAGCNHYLSKPVSKQSLYDTILNYLAVEVEEK